MNHIYRIVRNHSTGMLQAVCETATAQGKSSAGAHGTGICATTHRQLTPSAVSAAIAALFGAVFALCMSTPVHAAPTGGQITAGQGSISQASTANGSGINTTINQASQKLAINWQQFGSAAGEHIQFNQPGASAIALNRVVGNEQSQLMGSLSANGQVFILNPNGILFGKGAQVNTGGLVASTLNMSDADFMAGNYRFTGSNTSGKIENHGKLSTNGGIIALIAPAVENQGNITAHSGQVALTAGSQVTLTPQGQLYGITVDAGAVQAQITNGGIIAAEGGKIHLTAKAWDALSNALIKHSGSIEANTTALNEKGEVILLADMQHGKTEVSGSITAEGTHAGTDGGFIETSGAQVNVADSAHISTQANGGKTGTWLIDLEDITIAATGGNITGAALGAALGSNSVTIQTGGTGQSGSCTGATCTGTGSITNGNGDIFVNDAVSWNTNTTLTLQAHRNININQTMSGGLSGKLALQYGQGSTDGNNIGTAGNNADYTVNVPVNLAAGDNFSTKKGSGGTQINYTVITQLGQAGHENTAGNNTLQGMAHTSNLGKNYALGANIDASNTSGWNASAGFNPIGNNASKFKGKFDGLGHTIKDLGIKRESQNYIGLFGWAENAAISNIGLSGGSVSGEWNVGSLLGRQTGGTITNAYAKNVALKGKHVGGLVGYQIDKGVISNSYTESVTVQAMTSTGGKSGSGGFLGVQEGSSVVGSHSINSSVTGDNATSIYMGGMVGWQAGGSKQNAVLDSSYAANTTVIGNSPIAAGGLVGFQSTATSYVPIISNSYATGNVTGASQVGGLVGDQEKGTISNAYATGNVTGTGTGSSIGGLVGRQQNTASSISQSYATGTVSGKWSIGGLVGAQINGSISESYATGAVTGWHAGGLVGMQTQGSISNVYATGSVTGVDNASAYGVGGLVGNQQGGSISNAYATGKVTGVGANAKAGGLLGQREGASPTGTIANSYWDKETTTQTISANSGATSKTTVEMKQADTFTGWSIDSAGGDGGKTWRIYEDHTSPLLKVFLKPLTVTATVGDNNKTYNGTNQSATVNNYSYSTPGGTVDNSKILGFATTSNNSQRNAGSYVLAYGGGLYSIQSGYDILPNANLGMLIINKANLTSLVASRGYDGTKVVAGDKFTTIQGIGSETLTITGNGDAANLASKNVTNGTSVKLVSVSGLVLGNGSNGELANNYNWSDAALAAIGTNQISINKAAVTLGIDNVTKTYDGTTAVTNPTRKATSGSVFGSDSINSDGSIAFENKNAGTTKVTVSGITINDGNNGSNYDISYANNTASMINKAELTVRANNQAHFQGLAFVFSGTEFAATGLVASENIARVDLSSAGAAANALPGKYAIAVGSITGATGFDLNNYDLQVHEGQMQVIPVNSTGYVEDLLTLRHEREYEHEYDLEQKRLKQRKDGKLLKLQPRPVLTIIDGGIKLPA